MKIPFPCPARVRSDLDAMAPDLPRWVEARGMLQASRCLILGDGREDTGGYVLVSSDGPLMCAVGRPPVEVVREGIALHRGPLEILVSPDVTDVVAEVVGPEW